MHARERYAPTPMVFLIRFGQLLFVVTEHGIRFGLNAREAANRQAGAAASRRMTVHGRRKRKRAA